MSNIKSVQDLLQVGSADIESICTSASVTYKKSDDRVLLTVGKKHDLNNPLARCCSGVILDISGEKPKPLAVPPMVLNIHPKLASVDANWDKYDQYIVRDGTIVTLYWYGSWKISSMNGYEVDSFKWQGDRTYSEVLTELFKKYPKFHIDNLDHNMSYTIGFRCADFHPFQADPPGVWLVCAYDLVNMCTKAVDIGLPVQRPLQTRIPSLARAIEINNGALDAYFNRKEVHYGFILRAREDIGAVTNVLLESSLLRKIRQLVYHIPEARIYKVKSNHINLCTLRAYLNYINKPQFLRLFPKYEKQFKEYDILFEKLANRVRNILRNKTARVEAMCSQSSFDRAAVYLVLEIEKNLNINAYDGNSASILRDFITNPQYIKMYYELLY